jgi:hypothetical protein
MNIKTRVFRNCLLFAVLTLIVNTLAFYFLAEPILYKGYVLPKQELRERSSFMMGDSHAGVIRQQDLDRVNITNFAFDSESYFDIISGHLKYLIVL